jgi:homoserine dehydrogenase
MYYGSGAGSLPTASAVCGDVIDCVKHKGITIRSYKGAGDISLISVDEVARPFFVRFRGSEEEAKGLFGSIHSVTTLSGCTGEIGFITDMMPEKEFKKLLASAEKVISWYRRGKNEEKEG